MSGIEKHKLELIETAKAMVQKGKGILAADESVGTEGKRFETINVTNTEEHREAFRELLFTTEGIENYLSGIILFHETIYETTKSGVRLSKILSDKKILYGIKLDLGVVDIQNTDGETFTQGLDNLSKRCAKYYEDGCRFAKWRAVFKISKTTPSNLCIEANAEALARYAIICQENGLVPMIEPEILEDGAHDIDECAKVTEKVIHMVMDKLFKNGVLFEGMILKPNMVTPGMECTKKSSHKEIAWKTIRTLMRTVPPSCGGVAFLSGGQSEEEATMNLNEMNILINNELKGKVPYSLTFSYGRALQTSCLHAWLGKDENKEEAQKKFLEIAKNNSLATKDEYEKKDNSEIKLEY